MIVTEFADKLSVLAVRALITEACVTPKPGLVDRANNGAHDDMDVFTFIDSALSLLPYFRDIVLSTLAYEGAPDDLLSTLQPLGLKAESDMFCATNGVNTHKGAIFSIGLICAAASVLAADCDPQMVSGQRSEEGNRELGYMGTAGGLFANMDMLSATCANIAAPRVRSAGNSATNGERVFGMYGLSGILGEASAGFPSVFETALPIFRRHLSANVHFQDAAVAALLHLIAHVDDTNIAARCGMDVLRNVQANVAKEISGFDEIGQYIQLAKMLDKEFIKEGISPGGSADLLAAMLFIHSLGVGSQVSG